MGHGIIFSIGALRKLQHATWILLTDSSKLVTVFNHWPHNWKDLCSFCGIKKIFLWPRIWSLFFMGLALKKTFVIGNQVNQWEVLVGLVKIVGAWWSLSQYLFWALLVHCRGAIKWSQMRKNYPHHCADKFSSYLTVIWSLWKLFKFLSGLLAYNSLHNKILFWTIVSFVQQEKLLCAKSNPTKMMLQRAGFCGNFGSCSPTLKCSSTMWTSVLFLLKLFSSFFIVGYR